MTETNSLTPEQPTSPEQKNTKFTQIVFGHSYKSLDRDQIITHYIATQAGVINLSTPVSFAPEVDPNTLQPTTLAIEGIKDPHNQPSVNQPDGNFFDNGPDNTPTGSIFYEKHPKLFASDPKKNDQIKNLSRWLKAVENPEAKDKSEFSSQTRSLLNQTCTHVLRTLKERYPEPQRAGELLSQLHTYLDTILTSQTESLSDSNSEFQQLVSRGQQLQEADINLLREKFSQEPHRIQYSQGTTDGPKVAFIDATGIDSQTGITGVVSRQLEQQQRPQPDLTITATDHESDKGIKFIIQGTDSIQILLQDRLNQSEALFGGGYNLQGYGGHPGLVISPRSEGSQLDPQAVYHGIREFLRSPRFTEKDFSQVAQDFATQTCNLETVAQIGLTSGHEYSLPERQLAISIPNQESRTIVTLTEKELDLYQKFFAQANLSIEQIHQILLQKTPISEAPEISRFRSEQAVNKLNQLLNIPDSLDEILDTLDDLNHTQCSQLAPDLMLQVMQLIANSPDAINAIYNPQNTRFRITLPQLPEWMLANFAKYQASRYQYLSLPHKINSIFSSASTYQQADETTLRQLALELYQIYNSSTYQEIGQHFDPLPAKLQQLIPYLPPEIAQQLHLPENPIQTKILDIESPHQGKLINPEELREKIHTQIESNQTPQINILLQIGRDVREQLANQNFPDFDENADASLSIDRALNSDEAKLIAQHLVAQLLLAWHTAQEISSDFQINLATSGLPGELQRAIPIALIGNSQIPRETIEMIFKHLNYIEYSVQDSQFTRKST